jgi:hypothetical protein
MRGTACSMHGKYVANFNLKITCTKSGIKILMAAHKVSKMLWAISTRLYGVTFQKTVYKNRSDLDAVGLVIRKLVLNKCDVRF